MIMLLYGKDTYRSLQRMEEIRRAFIEKTRGDAVVCESETVTREALEHHLRTDGLFTRDKLIIIKNLITEGGAKTAGDLLPLFVRAEPYIHIVLFERDAIDTRNAAVKKLIAATVVNGTRYYPEHTPLEPKDVREAIVRKLAHAGKTIESSALETIAHTITDSFLLIAELNKLVHTEDRRITNETLADLSSRDTDDSIFHLTDAITEHRTRDALSILARLLESGGEPLKILSMLHRHARIIAKINAYLENHPRARTETIAEDIKEHPFAVKKTLATARRASEKIIAALYEHLLDTDRRIKKSAAPSEALLARVVYRMSV